MRASLHTDDLPVVIGKISQERLREMFAELDTIPQKVEELLESCNAKCKAQELCRGF